MLEPHFKRTAERTRQSNSKYILAIQDGMRLNFTDHPAKTEFGRIGKANGREQYGLIQHSTMLITDKNEPLGLIDLQHFDYEAFDTEVHHHHRPIEDKVNYCWIAALSRMRERLNGNTKRIITVADREGDFYEFLHPLIEKSEEFVIRAQHNRYTGEKHRARGEKLLDLLKKTEIAGTVDVEIQDVNSREIKIINLNLKATTVVFPSPNKSKEEQAAKRNFSPITLNAIHAYNNEYEWILLTNLPITTLEQLKEITEIYRSRWHIEDYHKVLKTGYQVDEIYLHSSRDTIENLLVMASISACRLYWLIYVGRVELDIKAERLFEEFEWKAIYVYFKEKIPEECPSLSEIISRIARLGGYKKTKYTKLPGIKTLWIGYQQFSIAAQMYRNMSSKT